MGTLLRLFARIRVKGAPAATACTGPIELCLMVAHQIARVMDRHDFFSTKLRMRRPNRNLERQSRPIQNCLRKLIEKVIAWSFLGDEPGWGLIPS